jgi:hypothetical protein
MDKSKQVVEVANESTAPETTEQEVRTLKDLEMVLVGGGDGMVTW